MSLDAEAMLEVNHELIFNAALSQQHQGVKYPLVVSLATFGRGIKQEILQAFEAYRVSWGHNQSLVATPPASLVRSLSQQELPPPTTQGFTVVGYAFGKVAIHQWNWDDKDPDALF